MESRERADFLKAFPHNLPSCPWAGRARATSGGSAAPGAPACGFGAGRVPEHSDRTDSTRPTDPETRHVDLECSHLQSSFYQRPGYGLFEKLCGASGSEQSASRGFTVLPGGPRGAPRAPGAPSLPGGQSPSEFLLSRRLLSATVCLQVCKKKIEIVIIASVPVNTVK